ncbi:DUF3078 domain-containing protein [Flavobacteriaceae bacterium LMO-SS05]
MKRSILLTLLLLFTFSFGFSQTLQELKAEKAAKKDSISKLQKRVDQLQKQIDKLPGWKLGAFGTIGGSFSNFNNWFAQGTPNNSSGSLGISFNGYANLLQEKSFWRNALTTNLNWVKFDNKDDPNDDDSFKPTTDVFNLTSLYGRNMTEKLAVSTLMEYRTTLLNNFNDPGYLDFGLGVTWTPIQDLIVVIHPIDYNFVMSKGDNIFESSFGTKLLADYTRQIGAISFKSNLSMFQSYKNGDLSNWTWTNSFGYSLWKMIGVGFDFGLRSNKQEALNYAIDTLGDSLALLDTVDNTLQTYYTIGLSYKF